MNMQLGVWTRVLVFLTMLCGTLNAQTSEQEAPKETEFDKLYQDIQSLVRQYSPEGSTHLLKNKIQFEYNTRIFMVHIPYKTGEWQDATARRGPKKGGIYGEIEISDGPYQAAAAAPQLFDEYYYTVLLMAPYSEEFNNHLYVHLYTPKIGGNPEFKKRFISLINNYRGPTPPLKKRDWQRPVIFDPEKHNKRK